MTMFKSKRAYIVTFILYAVCLWPMIRAGMRKDWFLHAPNNHPQFIDTIGAAFCAVFFLSLWKKTSNVIERSALICTAVVCILWMLNVLSAYGLKWSSVPANFAISTGIAMVAAVSVGIRAVQS
jgi:hypothetical protein